ncbi:MAG: STAS domain-containing protein [Magnetococcales bacterium]|nr:STAS domain-containing protein [Magnetococcales bacterium]
MAGTVMVDHNDDDITIKIDGLFNFTMHTQFRTAYQNCPMNGKRFIIDLTNTQHIDSSAFGMLLLLREYAGINTATVELANPCPEVRKILEAAHFHRFFKITPAVA